MPQMIKRGKELIRISPVSAGKLEYSSTDGRSWAVRFQPNSYIGDFLDLIDNGKEILAQTTKGLFYSTTEGRSWAKRS